MAAVAREAHVDVTTVSYHFGTRIGLIESLMDRLYREPVAAFVESLQDLPSERDRVRAYFDCVRTMYVDRDASRVYFEIVTLALGHPALRARLGQLNQWIVSAFTEAIHDDLSPEKRLAADLTFAVIDGIDLHRALADDDHPVEDILGLYERLVLPILTGEPSEHLPGE